MFTELRLSIIYRYPVYVHMYDPHHDPMKDIIIPILSIRMLQHRDGVS